MGKINMNLLRKFNHLSSNEIPNPNLAPSTADYLVDTVDAGLPNADLLIVGSGLQSSLVNNTLTISSSGAGLVSSVSAADGTLTVTPTTGAVTAKIPSSVALPGSPTTTTQALTDNSTKLATTAHVFSLVSAASGVSTNIKTQTITAVFDGGGSTLSTGIRADIEIDFACTIQQATLLADQSGNIVIDIWKDTYANFPPTVADTITASAKPTISSATKSQDSTLTGWTTSVTAGDILRFNIDSVTTITRCTLSLKVLKT